LGAGSASVGVANNIVAVMMEKARISREEALKRFYFVDSKGLVTMNRESLEPHKVDFARKDVKENLPDLLSTVKHVKPTAL
jgi:malate dehydrogenase (oxaloacetate-decarboxylating)(NADP+)